MSESSKIKNTDIIQPDLFGDTKKSADELFISLKQLEEGFTNIILSQEKILKQNKDPKTAKEIKTVTLSLKENERARWALIEVQKQEKLLLQETLKAEKLQLEITKKQAAEANKLAKEIEVQNSAYKKAVKDLNEVKKAMKDLSVQGKSTTDEYKKLSNTFKELDSKVRTAEEGVKEFQRSVGSYKEGVKAAIDESEAFAKINDKLGEQGNLIAGSFGKVVKTLKEMKKAQDASASGFSKIGTALKASGIALIITLLTGVAGFMNQGRESALKFELALSKWSARLSAVMSGLANIGSGVIDIFNALGKVFKGDFKGAALDASKGVDQMKHSFDGFEEKVDSITPKIEELARLTFKYEDDIRGLQLALADSINNEGDLAEIANDTTLGYKERNKALEEGAKLREKIAIDELAIATKQRELAEKELELQKAKSNGDPNNELLNKLNQALIEEKNAIDKKGDLEREEAQKLRKMREEEIIGEIELVRSKKNSADSQVAILTKQLADEENQLEERFKFANDLRKANIQETEYEFDKLSQLFNKQIDFQDLINTNDAVALAQKIKAFNLDEAQQTELAKIVKQAQEDRLAYEASIEKLEKERIKRMEKIAEIQRLILLENTQSELDIIADLEAKKQKIYEESNSIILEGDNVFNREMERNREEAYNSQIALLEQEQKKRIELLNQQKSDEQIKNEETEKDEIIREEKRKEIENKYRHLREKEERDSANKKKELEDKEVEEKRQIEIKKTEIVLTELSKVANQISNDIDARSQREQEAYNRDLEKRRNNIDKQRELAAKGLDNELAYQEAAAEKQELKRIKAEEKANRQKEIAQLVDAYFNSLNARLQQKGTNPSQASALALSDVLLAKGVSKGLMQFAKDGDEDVQPIGIGGQIGVDDIPYLLTRNEGVVTRDGNLGNPGVVKSLNDGTFADKFIPKIDVQKSFAENISSSIFVQQNNEIANILKDIKNKPVQQVDVDGLGNLINTVYVGGRKEVTKHINKKPRI